MSKITEEMIEAGVRAHGGHRNIGAQVAAIYTAMHKARPVEEGMVDRLPTDCELWFYRPTYGDDDDQSEEWRVHRWGGGINDREWTMVSSGKTPTEAISNAIQAIGDNDG